MQTYQRSMNAKGEMTTAKSELGLSSDFDLMCFLVSSFGPTIANAIVPCNFVNIQVQFALLQIFQAGWQRVPKVVSSVGYFGSSTLTALTGSNYLLVFINNPSKHT